MSFTCESSTPKLLDSQVHAASKCYILNHPCRRYKCYPVVVVFFEMIGEVYVLIMGKLELNPGSGPIYWSYAHIWVISTLELLETVMTT
jgi:hypothetical protein